MSVPNVREVAGSDVALSGPAVRPSALPGSEVPAELVALRQAMAARGTQIEATGRPEANADRRASDVEAVDANEVGSVAHWFVGLLTIILASWLGFNHGIVALAALLLPFAYLVYGASCSCPHCERWWAAREVRRTLIDSSQAHREVVRKDQTRDTDGKLLSTTSRKEQVVVTENTHRVEKHCVRCDEIWTETVRS